MQQLILRRFVMGNLEQIFYNYWGDYEIWKWIKHEPMKNPKTDTAKPLY